MGRGPLEAHVEHAADFCRAVRWASSRLPSGSAQPSAGLRVVDLGSGSGLPGLALALDDASLVLALIESQERRCAFLEAAIERLGLGERVSVVHARAEQAGRSPEHRGRYQVAVARSFGPPAVTAECAAPLLAMGGRLVVSEPPAGEASSDIDRRWPTAGLAMVGMGVAVPFERAHRFVVITQEREVSDRFPRRVGVPTKRPLF